MKVGLDVRPLQFKGANRGTGRYITSLLQALYEFEPNTQYCLFFHQSLPVPEIVRDLADRFEPAPVPGHPWPNRRHPWYLSRAQLRGALPYLVEHHWKSHIRRHSDSFLAAARSRSVDLVHVLAPFDPFCTPLALSGVKTVFTFLDAIPLLFRERTYDNWPPDQQRLYELQRKNLATADRVVGLSDSSCRDAVRLFDVPQSRVSTVYCCVDLPRIEPAPLEVLRAKHRIRAPYFLFCSSPDYHKGLDVLIQALGLYKERNAEPIQLVLVCSPEPRQHQWIRTVAFDAGLTGSDIRVTGYVSQEELLALYRGAVAVVSPSRCEGFGYPAAEAMAAGVPVIVANSSSLPEVVGDAGMLYETEDVAALAAAMDRVAHDAELRNGMVEKGHAQVTRFRPEAIARAQIAVYRSLTVGTSEGA